MTDRTHYHLSKTKIKAIMRRHKIPFYPQTATCARCQCPFEYWCPSLKPRYCSECRKIERHIRVMRLYHDPD
jgi:hypothetical protein